MVFTDKTVELTGKQCMAVTDCIKSELYGLEQEIKKLSEKRTEAEIEGHDGAVEILTGKIRAYERTCETLRAAMKKLIW